MWNIMKAQNYQTKRDNVIIYTFLAALLFFFLVVDYGAFDELSGSLFFAGDGEVVQILCIIVTLVLVCRICGWDLTDKTVNYEVLSGHKRAEVYFGRVVIGLLWSVVSCMVVTAIPILVFSIIKGWGESLGFLTALTHYMLLIFPLLRLACEITLLTFLINNCYAAMLIGWVLVAFSMMGGMVLEELFDTRLTIHFATTNISALFQFDNYSTMEIGGETVIVFKNTLEPSLVISTIVVSLLVGGSCLAIGYLIFRKRDLR